MKLLPSTNTRRSRLYHTSGYRRAPSSVFRVPPFSFRVPSSEFRVPSSPSRSLPCVVLRTSSVILSALRPWAAFPGQQRPLQPMLELPHERPPAHHPGATALANRAMPSSLRIQMRVSRVMNTVPGTPVNAYNVPLRPRRHDWGRWWVATAFHVRRFHPLLHAGLSRRFYLSPLLPSNPPSIP